MIESRKTSHLYPQLDCPQVKNNIIGQRGVALIIVLLIVAVIAILATQMTSRLQLNLARTMNIKENNQAYWYAVGAEQFAKKSLRTLVNANLDNINLSQEWAKPFEYPIENGVIRAQLNDMQACFNLNGVLSIVTDDRQDDEEGPNDSTDNSNDIMEKPNLDGKPVSVLALEDLLKNFISDSLVVDTLRDSIIDWLDADDFSSTYGAEDIDYESLPQPYLSANSQMANLSELRLINGADEALRNGWLTDLLEQVCVIPEATFKLNVNTVQEDSAPTLAALTGLSVDDARQVISNRPEDGYRDINDFLNESTISALGMPSSRSNWFAVTTKYFKLTTSVETTSGSQFTMVTLFNIEGNEVKIVSREFGGV